MNGIKSINASNLQIAFMAKPGNRKQIHEFIDKTGDLAADVINKDEKAAKNKKFKLGEAIAAIMPKIFIGTATDAKAAPIERINYKH